MPRCPNGTRKNKKTGECVKTKTRSPPKTRSRPKTRSVRKTLTKVELDNIIQSFRFTEEKKKQLAAYLPKFRRMKYDPEYTSCFTGRPTLSLHAMVEDKIACWAKYSDSP